MKIVCDCGNEINLEDYYKNKEDKPFDYYFPQGENEIYITCKECQNTEKIDDW